VTDGLDTDRTVEVLRRAKCCGCGGALPARGPLNMVLMDKRADWSYPTHGNVMVPGSGGRAVSVLCHYCLRGEIPPRTAIEVRDDGTVVHHPLDGLLDLPAIGEEAVP
jgi:hypothetical protein